VQLINAVYTVNDILIFKNYKPCAVFRLIITTLNCNISQTACIVSEFISRILHAQHKKSSYRYIENEGALRGTGTLTGTGDAW